MAIEKLSPVAADKFLSAGIPDEVTAKLNVQALDLEAFTVYRQATYPTGKIWTPIQQVVLPTTDWLPEGIVNKYGATTFLGLTDVDAPTGYVGQANKVVSVKSDESGLEFTVNAGSQNLFQTLTIGNDGGGLDIVNVSTLKDSASVLSVDIENRGLYEKTGVIPTVSWDKELLTDSTGINSVDWQGRKLTDNAGNPTFGWNTLTMPPFAGSGDGFILIDNTGQLSFGVVSVDGITITGDGTAGNRLTATGSGFVPSARTLTINGSAQDLSANRTWTITTTGTLNRISVSGGSGLTPTVDIDAAYIGQTSITTVGTLTAGTIGAGFTAIANARLANSSLTIGTTTISLGGTSLTLAGLTSVTSTTFIGALTGNASTATALATGRTISVTGDLAYTSGSFDGTANVTGTGTLATVNANVGTFGSATQVGVFTVNGKGLITAASNVTITGFASSTLTTNHIFVGVANVATDVAMSGDATIVASGALTLANTAVAAASYTVNGGALFTVDSKGRLTSASNVTITVTGTSNKIDVSGGTGITPTITISPTYVGQTSITTLGTIGTGIWQGTKVGLAFGGTNADLSATGGAAQYLKQSSAGAAITVGTISASDIASGAALTKTDDTNVTLTLGGTPTSALLQATSLTLGWTGTLADSRLSTTTVVAGSYGSASSVATFTVGATGRLTIAATTAIQITESQVTNLTTDLANIENDALVFALAL